MHKRENVRLMRNHIGLYTDESPGLKVDPFVVMVLSIGFIISVVALHSKISS
jgi:preprotein translocase subunit Sec61beta